MALEALPDDLSILNTGFDGAAVPPTVDMVAAGSVLDLTDFAGTDPDFDPADFYKHIWYGALWNGRLWYLPLTAEFQLLYYDKEAFAFAGLPGPNLFWLWDEIDNNGPIILASQPEYSSLTWHLIDVSRDVLYAYAYSLADSCPDTAAPPCLNPLQPHHKDGALEWYKEMVQRELMPDLTQLDPADHIWFLNNFQSARRHALFWVDEPIRYEYYQLLDPVGIVPFPGVERIEGVTPLWVDGAFINSNSERPYATWLWLKFLSHQPPDRSYRLVPARPSVAERINYWSTLPRQLVDVMRTAYNFSRPVTLSERHYFEWEQLEEVVSGARSSQEIAQQPPYIEWFGR